MKRLKRFLILLAVGQLTACGHTERGAARGTTLASILPRGEDVTRFEGDVTSDAVRYEFRGNANDAFRAAYRRFVTSAESVRIRPARRWTAMMKRGEGPYFMSLDSGMLEFETKGGERVGIGIVGDDVIIQDRTQIYRAKPGLSQAIPKLFNDLKSPPR